MHFWVRSMVTVIDPFGFLNEGGVLAKHPMSVLYLGWARHGKADIHSDGAEVPIKLLINGKGVLLSERRWLLTVS